MNKYIILAISIVFPYSCNDNGVDKENTSATTTPSGIPSPQPITFKIDSIYPHDPKAFTQGLEFYKGKLYEGTGMQEESNLRIVDIPTGRILQNHHIEDTSIFGEGITIFKEKIYQLTWTQHKVFVYNLNNLNNPVKTLNWNSEGWGLTHDSSNLIVSDGSSNIYFVSPEDFHILKTISIVDNNGSVDQLNELEMIGGYLFANRWQTDEIVKIDISNGHVVGKMNLTGLLAQYDSKDMNNDTGVLNGIAYDSVSKRVFITGKHWPRLFVMHLNN